MMLRPEPREAYRRSHFDARLLASGRDELVLICLDDLIENLGVLQLVEAREDRAARSRTLTRCITALTALEMGIDRDADLATSLLQFYGAAKNRLLDSIRNIDADEIKELQSDMQDIADAFRASKLD